MKRFLTKLFPFSKTRARLQKLDRLLTRPHDIVEETKKINEENNRLRVRNDISFK
ncbi:MAG TPA: hypothetical protein VNA17_11440 [Pyrinomonadaceae bacterium]|nr:hypothetical protein [Pyrinomonadaceae bacterium]